MRDGFTSYLYVSGVRFIVCSLFSLTFLMWTNDCFYLFNTNQGLMTFNRTLYILLGIVVAFQWIETAGSSEKNARKKYMKDQRQQNNKEKERKRE